MIIIFLFGLTCYAIISTIQGIHSGGLDNKTIVAFIGYDLVFILATTISATVFFPANVDNAISNKKIELMENVKWIDETVKSDAKEDMMKEEVEKYNDYLSSSVYYHGAAIIYYPFYRTANNIELSTIDIDSITMDNYMEIILKSGKENK